MRALETPCHMTHDRDMARYEITARATAAGLPPLAVLESQTLTPDSIRRAGLRMTNSAPDELTFVLTPPRHFPPECTGTACLAVQSGLRELGIHMAAFRQIDVHRVSRRGGRRTLIASWTWPGSSGGPGAAGVREPRKPLPNPPHLRAKRDQPT
jgi:hypothetical protein